jgi:hypothetical protein
MTHKIQSRYMSDTYGIHRDTHQDTYLEPYLRPRLDTPKPPRYVSRMYPACIPHVSRMYLDYLAEDTCISDVSRMYPVCLLHIRYISLWMVDAFEIHVSHHVSWMYPACILITLADTCISHVSRMYLASQIRTSS